MQDDLPADSPETRPAGNASPLAHLIVRQAVPEDAKVIYDLLEPEVQYRKLLQRSIAEIAELTRHGFVAEYKGRCIGFAAIEVYSPKLAEIQSLVTHKDYRKHGIGRQLVLRCLERARELDIMEVMAISSSEAFLQSCGFDYSLPDQKKALFAQLRSRFED